MSFKRFLNFWGPVVVWCGVIFTFSSIPTLPRVGFVWWDFVLKKTAHMTEYGILFFLVWRAARDSFKLQLTSSNIVGIFLFGLFYAASDEFHQSFIFGRTATIRDVGFDFVGMLLSWQWIKRRYEKQGNVKTEFITDSAAQTQALARQILPYLSGGNVVCLYGDLGSGKTTLVQGLAKALGVKGKVQSPTFQLVREYELVASSKLQAASKKSLKLETCDMKRLVHVDCYRIESAADLKGVDLQEYWQDKDNLVVIEWAERIKDILPENRLDVCFEQVGENKRRITLFNHC